MKTYTLLISLFLVSILFSVNSYAQRQDSIKQNQIKYLSRTLSMSQDSAKLVAAIMVTYKESVKRVIADGTLSEEMKRVKIDNLIEEKNKKLELILTPSQQVKVIPTTERKKKRPGK